MATTPISSHARAKAARERMSFFPMLSLSLGLITVLLFSAFSVSGGHFFAQTASANTASTIDTQAASGAVSGRVLIAQATDGPRPARLSNPLGQSNGTLISFLNKVLDVFIMLGSIVVVFMIIIAGLKYVTAKGDEKQISAAHTQLTWTAIGAAILLGAKVLSMVIQNTVRTLAS